MSLHCFVTLQFWSSDALMSPLCQFVDTKFMTPSHPCLLFVGTFSGTVKTLSRSWKKKTKKKLYVSSNSWIGRMLLLQDGCFCYFDIHDTIQSWRLFVSISSKSAEFRCAAVYWKWYENCWPNLSVKFPYSSLTKANHKGKKPAQDNQTQTEYTFC